MLPPWRRAVSTMEMELERGWRWGDVTENHDVELLRRARLGAPPPAVCG